MYIHVTYNHVKQIHLIPNTVIGKKISLPSERAFPFFCAVDITDVAGKFLLQPGFWPSSTIVRENSVVSVSWLEFDSSSVMEEKYCQQCYRSLPVKSLKLNAGFFSKYIHYALFTFEWIPSCILYVLLVLSLLGWKNTIYSSHNLICSKYKIGALEIGRPGLKLEKSFQLANKNSYLRILRRWLLLMVDSIISNRDLKIKARQ